MYLYFMLITLSIALKKIVSRRIYFVILYTLMGIIAGIRSVNVGIDTVGYYALFYEYQDYTVPDILNHFYEYGNTGVELGFQIMVALCSNVSSSPEFMIFVSSILSYILYGKFIFDNTSKNNYWLATVVLLSMGYYFYSLAVLRQALSTAIAIQSIGFLLKNKYSYSVICVALATLFHSSAIIFIPIILMFIIEIKAIGKNHSSYYYLFISSGIVAFLILICSGYVLQNLDEYSVRLANYTFANNKYNGESSNGLYMWSQFVLYFAVIVISIVYANRLKFSSKIKIVYASLFLIIACICIVAKQYIQILLRLMYHFEPFAWILIAFVLSKIGNVRIRYFCYVLFIIMSYVSIYFLGQFNDYWEAVPYESIIQ